LLGVREASKNESGRRLMRPPIHRRRSIGLGGLQRRRCGDFDQDIAGSGAIEMGTAPANHQAGQAALNGKHPWLLCAHRQDRTASRLSGKANVEKLFDELEFQRATQAFIWRCQRS